MASDAMGDVQGKDENYGLPAKIIRARGYVSAQLLAETERRARAARMVAKIPPALPDPAPAPPPEPPPKRILDAPSRFDPIADASSTIRAMYQARGVVTILQIQRVCARHFSVTVRDIRSARRTADVIMPRQIGFYLSRELTERSFPEIGRAFGGRDHSTAIHSAQKIFGLISEGNAKIIAAVDAIRAELTGNEDQTDVEIPEDNHV